MAQNTISDGKHFLSGVGHATIKCDNIYSDDVDVDLFCIDGITYGAFIDPDDGYRSYGSIQEVKEHKCQYTFPPQPVNIQNVNINEEVYCEDNFGEWYEYISKDFLRMTDAVNGKEVLEIGTDYSENYYPCAIFHYTPENLEINKNR